MGEITTSWKQSLRHFHGCTASVNSKVDIRISTLHPLNHCMIKRSSTKGSAAFETCVYGFPKAVSVYAQCLALLAPITHLGGRTNHTNMDEGGLGLTVKIHS